MKRVFVITLVGWLLFSNRSLAQNKMVADPPELMAAVNSARQLSLNRQPTSSILPWLVPAGDISSGLLLNKLSAVDMHKSHLLLTAMPLICATHFHIFTLSFPRFVILAVMPNGCHHNRITRGQL